MDPLVDHDPLRNWRMKTNIILRNIVLDISGDTPTVCTTASDPNLFTKQSSWSQLSAAAIASPVVSTGSFGIKQCCLGKLLWYTRYMALSYELGICYHNNLGALACTASKTETGPKPKLRARKVARDREKERKDMDARQVHSMPTFSLNSGFVLYQSM